MIGLSRADRILADAVSGHGLTPDGAHLLAAGGEALLPDLMAAARAVRLRRCRGAITFSRSVFLPVTNICRDRCGYCAFRKDPGDAGAWILTPDQVCRTVADARRLGCREVLFSLGDKPEVFPAVRARLAALGHRSMLDYLARLCRLVVEEYGLFPHTNAGVFGRRPMRLLRPWNLSMGLMVESVSERLCDPGGPHGDAPDKQPALRQRMLCNAGAERVPFTTGLLIGIGETVADRVNTLFAIAAIQQQYGHIQEVIVQNFCAKPGTPMAAHPEPPLARYLQAIALARLILGPEMNIQAPPNLNRHALPLLLDAGINDWGGVSPLTLDYINAEKPWPAIDELRAITAERGLPLRERLPIYPEFLLERPDLIAAGLRRRALAAATKDGYAKEE